MARKWRSKMGGKQIQILVFGSRHVVGQLPWWGSGLGKLLSIRDSEEVLVHYQKKRLQRILNIHLFSYLNSGDACFTIGYIMGRVLPGFDLFLPERALWFLSALCIHYLSWISLFSLLASFSLVLWSILLHLVLQLCGHSVAASVEIWAQPLGLGSLALDFSRPPYPVSSVLESRWQY